MKRSRSHPRFAVGDRVRVVLNERNRTPHEGSIREAIWHGKHQCWNYYLVEDGKKISKRYIAEDLEGVEAAPVGGPEGGRSDAE